MNVYKKQFDLCETKKKKLSHSGRAFSKKKKRINCFCVSLCTFLFYFLAFRLTIQPYTKQSPKMSATIYSYEEIAKHNNRADLWMAIDGKVYDITKFQDEVSTEKLSVSASDLVFDKIF